jgi:maleate cis-trans isomerase
LNSFFCKTTAELGAITEEQVLELALRTVTPQSVFIACSQLPTLNVVAKLRAQLDIPVWSSIQATAWAAAVALTAKGQPVRMTADAHP